MTVPWRALATRDDVVLIVSHPIGCGIVPVAGSVPHPCVECDQPVWLAPSSRAAMERPPEGITEVLVACTPCAIEHVPDVLRGAPMVLPGQGAEIVRELARRVRAANGAAGN